MVGHQREHSWALSLRPDTLAGCLPVSKNIWCSSSSTSTDFGNLAQSAMSQACGNVLQCLCLGKAKSNWRRPMSQGNRGKDHCSCTMQALPLLHPIPWSRVPTIPTSSTSYSPLRCIVLSACQTLGPSGHLSFSLMAGTGCHGASSKIAGQVRSHKQRSDLIQRLYHKHHIQVDYVKSLSVAGSF